MSLPATLLAPDLPPSRVEGLATAEWKPEPDGWLYRQQQWGEPNDFGHPYAFTSRGVIHARGWAVAALVDQLHHQEERAA